eukprot:ANDGO_02749.mRNA.1 hypothetical protein DICPUDRAFT_57722
MSRGTGFVTVLACCVLLSALVAVVTASVDRPVDRVRISVPSHDADAQHAIAPEESVDGGSDGLCHPCEDLVTLLESFVTASTTETDIEKFVDLVCPFIPKADQAVCPAMIAQMAPIILESLVRKENPTVVCTAIRLCPPQKTTFAIA